MRRGSRSIPARWASTRSATPPGAAQQPDPTRSRSRAPAARRPAPGLRAASARAPQRPGGASASRLREAKRRHRFLFRGGMLFLLLLLLLGRDVGLLLLERALERDEEVVPVGGSVRCDLLVDVPGDDEVDERRREGLHVEERALLDRIRNALGLVFADQVGDAVVGDHHLDRRNASAVLAWQQ